MADYKHLYGPVPSRRLGRSLGVDMVPMKTCCYDCVYCQLGPTTVHTAERGSYVDVDEVVGELAAWLGAGGTADWLTFAGCGEPMLNIDLGDAMARAREMSGIPVALLTNGALLWRKGARDAAMQADLIMPSLDAATEETFRRINRPVKGLLIEQVIDGLKETVLEFHGEVWLEVLLVAGINDSDEELAALGEAVREIRPEQVQINTVVRPAPGGEVERVDNGTLVRARVILGPNATVISSAWERDVPEGAEHSREEVLALVSYRPCTVEDVSHGLGMHPNEAIKYLQQLLSEGALRREDREGETFFVRA
ncbi:MAG: radical SAM protein [Armatimonadota bacterium]|jgi:wyosine [tRNA(Phe)-imidazoG37] synthetase (radical SAM superfamily)